MNTETRMVPLALIDPPKFNSRLIKNGKLAKDDDTKVEQMAAEFNDPKVGQEQPIQVEEKTDGRFELIFGSRRLRAAHKAGWKEIRADIKAPSPDADKAYRNIVENVSRENLTTFETARAAATLRDLGLKNPEIGNLMHVSGSHVSNLQTAYSNLPAPVRKDWEAGHPVATVQTMADIARKGKDDDAKVQLWDETVAAAAKEDRKPGKRGKGKKGPSSSAGFPVSQKRLGYVIEALSSKKATPELTDDLRKWGKALLDFVVSGRENPPGGIPKMPAKADKAEKEDAE